jgi:hypothetical protein
VIGCEEAIGQTIEYFDIALLFLIDSFQGFLMIELELFGDKVVPSLAVDLAPGFKIRTGQAARELVIKIVGDYIGTMGLWNQPALREPFSMSRAENIGALKELPARLLFYGTSLLSGDFFEVTFEQ